MQLSTTYFSFIQALNVMNAALERYRDSPVFKSMLSAAATELAGRDLVVAIVDSEDSPTAQDFVTIRLHEETGTFVVVTHGKNSNDIAWTVAEDYLNEVALHPGRYVDNPARLDFRWLKQQIQRGSSESGGLTAEALRRKR